MTSRRFKSAALAACVLVFCGWVGLVSAALIQAPLLRFSFLPSLTLSQRDLMTISQSLLLSGLAFALVLTLRRGFSALDRFFDAALKRAQDNAAPGTTADTIRKHVINGRACMQYQDGSVEVSTLLGMRRFDSMREAKAFVSSIMPPVDEVESGRPALNS